MFRTECKILSYAAAILVNFSLSVEAKSEVLNCEVAKVIQHGESNLTPAISLEGFTAQVDLEQIAGGITIDFKIPNTAGPVYQYSLPALHELDAAEVNKIDPAGSDLHRLFETHELGLYSGYTTDVRLAVGHYGFIMLNINEFRESFDFVNFVMMLYCN